MKKRWTRCKKIELFKCLVCLKYVQYVSKISCTFSKQNSNKIKTKQQQNQNKNATKSKQKHNKFIIRKHQKNKIQWCNQNVYIYKILHSLCYSKVLVVIKPCHIFKHAIYLNQIILHRKFLFLFENNFDSSLFEHK